MKDVILGLSGMGGVEWAYFGAALAAIGGGIGSSIGIATVSNVAAGVISEEPEKFGKVLPLIAMPGTQGIYGLITALLVLIFFGFFERTPDLSVDEGVRIFFSCLPVAFICLFSGIYQGAAGVGAAGMVARREEDAGKALILPALVETYAVFSLIVTILLLLLASQAVGA